MTKVKGLIPVFATLVCFFLAVNVSKAQNQGSDTTLIQFSGFVITADSSSPIPYATVKIKNEPRGTITNLEGFYSMVVEKKDTVVFSSMGFKSSSYPIAEHTKGRKLVHVQTLEYDTLMSKETVIRPWPTKERFREAFLNLDLPDNNYEVAQRNLQAQTLNKISENLPMDAREQYNLAQMRFHNESFYSGGNRRYYTAPGSGAPIPGSLLNPFAWAEFINAIKKGEFSE